MIGLLSAALGGAVGAAAGHALTRRVSAAWRDTAVLLATVACSFVLGAAAYLGPPSTVTERATRAAAVALCTATVSLAGLGSLASEGEPRTVLRRAAALALVAAAAAVGGYIALEVGWISLKKIPGID
ncbi:hypothetical protein P0W64_13930 [Tsukamurella sp. 8F]|uniref:hypothetical protein n=1 Tax=unclassified Tsukamurella TaxID=2633480 RepID=UPI0023B97B25|nr:MULTISPECIES: hypothetical protein [unclassified Tsukamurella]MDF0530672.1 hypothetical protein [Tsukamurella sp. 8J]MDF0587873.1 hypothetical protein [Tsukamurella sp. 8F]